MALPEVNTWTPVLVTALLMPLSVIRLVFTTIDACAVPWTSMLIASEAMLRKVLE